MGSYNEKLKECLREVYKCASEENDMFYAIYFHKEQWAPYFNFDFGEYFEDLLNPIETELALFQLEYHHVKCIFLSKNKPNKTYIMER